MPGPTLNQGGAPHDSDDIQDLWYALEQLGFTEGVLGQTDSDFVSSETISADENFRLEARAPGGDSANGQVISTGVFSVNVEWLDDNENVVRTEGVASNREANRWANYALDPKSPYINIVIVNDTSSQQTVSGTLHYR